MFLRSFSLYWGVKYEQNGKLDICQQKGNIRLGKFLKSFFTANSERKGGRREHSRVDTPLASSSSLLFLPSVLSLPFWSVIDESEMYSIRPQLEKWKNSRVYFYTALYPDTNYVRFYLSLFGRKMVEYQSSPCLNGESLHSSIS